MKNPLKREPKPYVAERDRLLEYLGSADPASDEYQKAMNRLNELDRMMNRTTELKKTVIPTLGTIGGVAGIYALQQFGGVLVPRVLEAIGSRSQQRHPRELD